MDTPGVKIFLSLLLYTNNNIYWEEKLYLKEVFMRRNSKDDINNNSAQE